MKIKKLENGYLLTSESGTESCFSTLEQLFTALLFRFEGRAVTNGAGGYGEVLIMREGQGQRVDPPANKIQP